MSRQPSRAGEARFPWTDEICEQVKRMFLVENLTASEIAKRINAPSRGTVSGKLERLGLKRGRAGGPPQRIAAKPIMPRTPAPATTDRDAPQIAPAALFRPQASTAAGGACTLHDLKRGCCRWPISPPHVYGADILFCAGTQEDGSPYCTEHRRKSGARLRTPAELAADRARTEAAKQRFAKTGHLPKREAEPQRRRA